MINASYSVTTKLTALLNLCPLIVYICKHLGRVDIKPLQTITHRPAYTMFPPPQSFAFIYFFGSHLATMLPDFQRKDILVYK